MIKELTEAVVKSVLTVDCDKVSAKASTSENSTNSVITTKPAHSSASNINGKINSNCRLIIRNGLLGTYTFMVVIVVGINFFIM